MKKSFIIISLCVIAAFAQTYTPISTLRQNDANGRPSDTVTIFTVKGVVTAVKEGGNSTSGPGSIQDGTAGISVYGTAFATGANLTIGDTVVVTSQLGFYNGLSQLDLRRVPASSLVTKVSSGTPPEPFLTTIPALKNQQWNGFEEFESRLVRINNVKFSDTTSFVTGTSGKTYTLTDTGGNTFDFRITTNAVGINGSPIPRGYIDVIGVIGQYKTSAPYSSGYQLLPRSVNDILGDGSPTINNNILVNTIDTTSFVVIFETVRKGNTQIKYGLTQALELDSVVNNNDTTIHIAKVSGLQKNKTYFFKAVSKNSKGTSYSTLQQVTTASGNSTLGTIKVYFNSTVDTTVAMPGNAAKGNADFSQYLINRINNATYSIDLALYSFNGLDNITNALISAKNNRGVKVRMVYDSRTTQASVQSLINAGIQISNRPSSSDIMHNKFWIFDGRDTVAENDWVWTGSWNATTTEATWKNNTLEINDPALAKAYLTEFEEMWGSNTDTPNPTAAKFGKYKTDNTPHSFTIGGRPVQLYFSPSDRTSSHIISTITSANKSIYFAVMAFTYNGIATEIKNRYYAGITDIKGIIDDANGTGSEFAYLKTFADMWANTGATLHSKYLVVDASTPNSAPTVLTGSHNWSANAETDNDENTIIITDLKIANQYMQEFKKRYNDLGGTGTFVVPVSVNENPIKDFSFQLYQNYPNPFNPVTTIRFTSPVSQHVKIDVFNSLGQLIGKLFDDYVSPGIYAVDFNSNFAGKTLASGVYYYRISAGELVQTKKMILNK